jgi:hypothetical protein
MEEDLYEGIKEFFAKPPDETEYYYDFLNTFWHEVLTYIEDNDISFYDLSKKLNISKNKLLKLMGTKNTNIKMMDLINVAYSLGLKFNIRLEEIKNV